MKSTPPNHPAPSATRRKTSEPRKPKVGDVLGGKYTLRRKLGEGGMGSVFAAHQRDFDRQVAIKVLLPRGIGAERLLKQLKREAKTLAAVDHPNVVNVFDAGVTEGGLPFLVMELVEGKTLRALCEKDGLLDPLVSITYARQIADALAAAHAKKIVHCDLKPDNVLLKSDGRVKVADFGLARNLEQAGNGSTDQLFDGCGTPFYMAPELWRQEAPSPASDVYALGATMIEMLTGKPMFHQDSVELLSRAEVRRKHLEERPESLEKTFASLLAPLGRLIDSMVAKAPRKRPTATKIAEELLREYHRLEPLFDELTRGQHEPDREDDDEDFERESGFESENGFESAAGSESAASFESENGFESADRFESANGFESAAGSKSADRFESAAGSKSADRFESANAVKSAAHFESANGFESEENETPETPWKPRPFSARLRAFLAREKPENSVIVRGSPKSPANAPKNGVGAFGTDRMTRQPPPNGSGVGPFGTERMVNAPLKTRDKGAFGTDRMVPPPTSKARHAGAPGTERKARPRSRAVPSDEAITRPQTARPVLPNARAALPWKQRSSPELSRRRRSLEMARHPLAIGTAIVFALLLGLVGRDLLQSLRASKLPNAAEATEAGPTAAPNVAATTVAPNVAASTIAPNTVSPSTVAPNTVAPNTVSPNTAPIGANPPPNLGPSAPKPTSAAPRKTDPAAPSVVDPWASATAQKQTAAKPPLPAPSATPTRTSILPFGMNEE